MPSPASHLVALLGLARAQEMLLTARWVPAEEAERWGLVTRIVADPDAAATELGRRPLPPLPALPLADQREPLAGDRTRR